MFAIYGVFRYILFNGRLKKRGNLKTMSNMPKRKTTKAVNAEITAQSKSPRKRKQVKLSSPNNKPLINFMSNIFGTFPLA
jgi:hypothetical protein